MEFSSRPALNKSCLNLTTLIAFIVLIEKLVLHWIDKPLSWEYTLFRCQTQETTDFLFDHLVCIRE